MMDTTHCTKTNHHHNLIHHHLLTAGRRSLHGGSELPTCAQFHENYCFFKTIKTSQLIIRKTYLRHAGGFGTADPRVHLLTYSINKIGHSQKSRSETKLFNANTKFSCNNRKKVPCPQKKNRLQANFLFIFIEPRIKQACFQSQKNMNSFLQQNMDYTLLRLF